MTHPENIKRAKRTNDALEIGIQWHHFVYDTTRSIAMKKHFLQQIYNGCKIKTEAKKNNI